MVHQMYYTALDEFIYTREAFIKKKKTRPGVDKVKPKVWFRHSL